MRTIADLNFDDDFDFVEVVVEADPAGHPQPERKEDAIRFLIHADAGCPVCSRFGAITTVLDLHAGDEYVQANYYRFNK